MLYKYDKKILVFKIICLIQECKIYVFFNKIYLYMMFKFCKKVTLSNITDNIEYLSAESRNVRNISQRL